MSLGRASRVSRAPIGGLMSVGIFWGGFSALVPDIKHIVGASDQQFGLALILSALGSISATYLVPAIGARLGRATLPIVGVLLAMAFFYPLFATSVTALAVALYFMGASVAMLDISSNVRLSALESRHGLHLMNLSHAMFSFAFGGAAFVAGLARKAGYGPAEILPVFSGVALLLVVMMRESADIYGTAKLDAEDAPAGTRPPWAAIILTAIVLFTGFVGENATEVWSALHIERTLGGAPGEGAFGPTMLGLSMGIIRLSGQFAADRFGEARLILWSAVCGVIGAIVIGAAQTQAIVLIGVAIMGVGMAVVVPSVNSILGRLVREDQRAHAISRAWMVGMLGFFIGPSMIGFVSQNFGLRVGFFVVAFVVAAMIPAILALGKLELGKRELGVQERC
jgi:MFS family permease